MDDFYIILTGAMVSVTGAILGSFLILRRMAMLSDAISHAVLPGLVLAYLLSGDKTGGIMLLGAAALGMLTTFLIELFHKRFKLQSDAAIGVTFTALFAIGIIMVSAFAGQVDLDADCVLYGEIAYVPLDLWRTASGITLGPKTTYLIGAVMCIVLLFLKFGFRGLEITTFDENYAVSLGISAAAWHYALMSMVSLSTVVAFEAVGAILVVAFFIIPPATAYLWVSDLRKMILLACLFGILSSVIGYYLASGLDASISASIATMSGVFFSLSWGWKIWSIGRLNPPEAPSFEAPESAKTDPT